MATAQDIVNDINNWYFKIPDDDLSYADPEDRDEEKDFFTEGQKEFLSGAWDELRDAIYSWSNKDNPTIVTDLGTYKQVEDFGGEGEGDKRWVVFSFNDGENEEQFFKLEGYYASWDGDTWDDLEPREVEAREVTVIQYFYKD